MGLLIALTVAYILLAGLALATLIATIMTVGGALESSAADKRRTAQTLYAAHLGLPVAIGVCIPLAWGLYWLDARSLALVCINLPLGFLGVAAVALWRL